MSGEKIGLLTELTSERERIVELIEEKISLNLNVALEYTKVLQELGELEEEVSEARARLKKARKPTVKVTI